MPDVLEILRKLPALCAARHPTTSAAILIRRGAAGYWPAPRENFDVEAFNAAHGITPRQVSAMVHGSIFGWDCAAADPDNDVNDEATSLSS